MLGTIDLSLIQSLSKLSEQQFALRNHYLQEFYERHKVGSIKDILNRFQLGPEAEILCKQAHKYALSINKFLIVSNAFIFKGNSAIPVDDLQFLFRKCNILNLSALITGQSFNDIKHLILKKLILKDIEQALISLKSSIENNLAQKPPKTTTIAEITLEIEKLMKSIPRNLIECLSLQGSMQEKLHFLVLSSSLQAPEIVIPEYTPAPGAVQATPRKFSPSTEQERETENGINLIRAKIKSIELMMDVIVDAYPKDNPEKLFLASFVETTFSLLLSLDDTNLGYQHLRNLDFMLARAPLALAKALPKKVLVASSSNTVDPVDPLETDDSMDNWDDIGEIPADSSPSAQACADDNADWDSLDLSSLTLCDPVPRITPSFDTSSSAVAQSSQETTTVITAPTAKSEGSLKTPVV